MPMKNCWDKNQEKESGPGNIYCAGPRLGDLVIEAQNVNKAMARNCWSKA